MANLSGQNIGLNYKSILNLGGTINIPLSTTLQAITDGDGVASPLQLATNRIALGTSTGTSLLNFPDAGTTAADGISFGSTISLYRFNANILFLTDATTLNLTNLRSQNTGLISTTLTAFAIGANTLTGSSATSALSITQTWNTTGNPTAIFANITNTASGTNANLIDLQVGGVSMFKVEKSGFAYTGHLLPKTSNIHDLGSAGYKWKDLWVAVIEARRIKNTAAIATDIPLITKGFTSQTANLFEAQDVSNNVLSYIKPDGSLNFGTTTGTGRINLPDTGTTAADGISFGASNYIFKDGDNQLLFSNVKVPNVGGTIQVKSGSDARFVVDGTKLNLTPLTLSGSSATSALSISQTWNTTGNPTAIFANITNTASGASANLMDLQTGGVSQFKVKRNGDTNIGGASDFSVGTGFGAFFRYGLTVGGLNYPVASAALEVISTTRGFLPPRMTTTQVNAIATPAEGLVVFNTTISHLCVYQGGTWVRLSHSPM